MAVGEEDPAYGGEEAVTIDEVVIYRPDSGWVLHLSDGFPDGLPVRIGEALAHRPAAEGDLPVERICKILDVEGLCRHVFELALSVEILTFFTAMRAWIFSCCLSWCHSLTLTKNDLD